MSMRPCAGVLKWQNMKIAATHAPLQAVSLLHNASLMLCLGLTLIVHTQPVIYTWP